MRQLLTALVLVVACGGHADAMTLTFSPQRPQFQAAADEYAAIWAADGPRIVQALERSTGIALPELTIEVRVFEGVSHSGSAGGPMYLRASYPFAVKQATVVHELAHRYVDALDLQPSCFQDVHQLLALILAEVWGQLWGGDFVRVQAAVESARLERYRNAWAGVVEATPSARKQQLEAFLRCDVAR